MGKNDSGEARCRKDEGGRAEGIGKGVGAGEGAVYSTCVLFRSIGREVHGDVRC